MEYKVTRRSNAVNYRITIKSNGEILLSVPLRATDEQIRDFLRKQEKWIKENYKKALDDTIIESLYEDSTVYILGKPYIIRTIYSDLELIEMESGFLSFYTTNDSLDNKKTMYNKFLKDLLIKETNESLERYLKITGEKVDKVEYKNMKKAFGRCYYNAKRIVFSPNIIHKTKHFIDAIVLHEVVHLKYPNHQKEFYDYVYKIMPEYDKYIKLYKE